ncbi:universal stress protein [Natribaculum luteum]|uniref:Universal stress protein n=1 Tax=Natribaculum luteum TaxID=1586232 RepID=A0ABD5NUW5_9EURY|nr:universal stress protein [Natribaculum luteum]
MYERILFPTDGSETTEHALEHAIDLADRYDAELHVLYVVDATIFADDVDTGAIVEEFETAGERIVDDVAGQARATDLEPVTTAVVRGTPHREILAYADAHDVDLLVMGTHGRAGIERYLLGSVTEKIVRLSEVPVLVVSRPET